VPAALQTIHFCRSIDGVRIAYATLGRGRRLPIVRAAHFLTNVEGDLDSPVWRPWLDELSRERVLLRYDARGCGLSDREPPALSFDAAVADLEAVIDAAGVDRFALLGCSQGCATAIAYAARHPRRVACLVVLGGFVRGALRRAATPEQLREARLLMDMVAVGWGRDNPAFRQAFTSLFIPDGTPEQVHWFNELERLSCSPEQAVRMLSAMAQLDVSDLATQVRCPTLVMHVRGDARVPFDEGRQVAGLVPGARFVPLEGRNHILLASEPAFGRCFEHLCSFVDAHGHPGQAVRAFPALTAGERDVVELIAHGLDNLQIAAHLGLAEKTVRNKVSAVFAKLDVSTRAQAIVRAREAGFGASPLPR